MKHVFKGYLNDLSLEKELKSDRLDKLDATKVDLVVRMKLSLSKLW